MMKRLYISAWILLLLAALAAILTNSFSTALLLVFSLIALGLVLTLAMWSVVVNTRDLKIE